jgi:zinc transport system substrate-binding protein
VIDRTSARSVELDPLGASLDLGPTLYPNLIRDMAARFENCLQ